VSRADRGRIVTHEITKVTNLRTGRERFYVEGKRVSRERFDCYRSIGVFFTESTSTVRRHHAVAVLRSLPQA
jgi:hypothetical protein